MKRKLLILALLALCALALPMIAQAEDSGYCGTNLIYKLTDTGALTISGTGAMTKAPWDHSAVQSVTINSGVTNIFDEAFKNCYNLTIANIPTTVTGIGAGAFEGCVKLSEIEIPYGLQTIGDRAFYGSGLTSLYIRNSITKIGDEAFRDCDKLETVTARLNYSELTEIGEHAFQDCDSLNSVTLGDRLKTIGGYAFADCANLTEFTIPRSVTTIGSNAFENDGGLTNVVIPNSVTALGESAFRDCYSLEIVKLSQNLPRINESTFAGCGLTSIIIPNSVKSIGISAFSGTSLATVTFGTGLTQIENNAFEYCSYLTELTIPTTVKVIGDYAFRDCSGLESVFIPKTVTSIGSNVFENHNANLVITCYRNSLAHQHATDNGIKVNLLDGQPVITEQPSSVKVNEGKTATFKVTADYADTFQWYYRKPSSETWYKIKSNGQNSSYKLTTAPKHNGYLFRCLVSNEYGSVYSGIVTLTVNCKPSITTQPQSVKVKEGADAVFSVIATGASGYRWYYRTSSADTWHAIKKNSTSATYTLTTAPKHNGYQFRCKVSNSVGSVWSNTVTLTVKLKPVITAQPENAKVNVGEKAAFTVTATDASSYKWYYIAPKGSWTAISKNGTSATYTLTAAARHNGYKFRCKVSSSGGSVWSDIVTLTVVTKPVITTQPTDAYTTVGKNVTFNVEATGAETYQWYYQKPGETGWQAVSKNGASATYTLTTAARHNGYKFKCMVANTAGSVYSSVVTLTVK